MTRTGIRVRLPRADGPAVGDLGAHAGQIGPEPREEGGIAAVVIEPLVARLPDVRLGGVSLRRGLRQPRGPEARAGARYPAAAGPSG